MTEKNPKISIGIPVYNGANYLGEMIDSILAQTFSDFELIITDNASTDETAEVVNSYAKDDPRIRYFLNEKNIGAAGNYNRCFEHGRGEYFKWCAHDDQLSPNYLEACLKLLEADPNLVMAYGTKVEIDNKGNELPQDFDREFVNYTDSPSDRFYFQTALLKAPCAAIFGLFRRSALEISSLHRPYYSSDRALLAEVAILGNYAVSDEAVYYCRMHETRSVNIADIMERSKWISGTSNRFTSAEHINLARHLFEITGRHKNVSSAWKLRLKLFRFMAHPRQVSRYILDVVGIFMPRVVFWIKSRSAHFKNSSNA